MKILTCLLVLIPTCCVHAQDHTYIRTEIINVVDAYHKAWESVDMEIVSKFHTDDFRYWWHGQLKASSNIEFVTEYTRILSTTNEWSMEIGELDIQFLSPEIVVIGFPITGTHLITTEGKKYDYGVGAFTYVWKKTGNEWKLAHMHESALEQDPDRE